MRPVPLGAPIVRAPESEAGPILTADRLVPVAEVNVRAAKVLAPKTLSVPEALASPALLTKNRPFKLEVEVAIKIPSARRLEVVVPSETVTAVVNTDPAPASNKQLNLPVVRS